MSETRNKFASFSLEGSHRHATTTEDFYETLEATDPEPRDILAEAIGAILEECMNRNSYSDSSSQDLVAHLETSFRKWVALVHIVRPDLLPGNLPAWRYAEALGCTRQAFSRQCTKLSDFLGGMKAPGMKSAAAREAYRLNKSTGCRKPKRKANRIGGRVDTAMRVHSETTLILAFERFLNGSAWDTRQRTALMEAGLIDDHQQLTEAGRKRLQEAQRERVG